MSQARKKLPNGRWIEMHWRYLGRRGGYFLEEFCIDGHSFRVSIEDKSDDVWRQKQEFMQVAKFLQANGYFSTYNQALEWLWDPTDAYRVKEKMS
jgi:hypothetical protein